MIHNALSQIPPLSAFNAVVACTVAWTVIQLIRMSRRRLRTTRLKGPPSPSFAFGAAKMLIEADDPAFLYESWAEKYGAAYEVPSILGRRKIVLYDPVAMAHVHAKQTWTYVRTPMLKKTIEQAFGRGLFWAEGENHKRQRRSLTPAFSIAAIRELTPIFYDSAHKAKGVWNGLIESSSEDGTIIKVRHWMNLISLDTIGLAGFSHDFDTLGGKRALVVEIFDSLGSSGSASAVHLGITLLAQMFPFLLTVPTPRTRLIKKMNDVLEDISSGLLARTKQELDLGAVDDKEEKSVIGLLIKAESADSEFSISKDEILAQMKFMLLAGYETTSISLTWALIELSSNPEVQTTLRNELLEHGSDATYDELVNGFPYLDAVVHETLRMHPPVSETFGVAIEDDVIPLSNPVRTKSGELVGNLSVAAGTFFAIPLTSINRSNVFWGDDAKTFNPGRWLEDDRGQNGMSANVKEIQGYRHLLTFADGPRICLGKNFAVAELKAVLSVLVKNFVFELRDGAETKIEMGRGFLPRPRLAGEVGCKVPLRVKPYVAEK